MQRFFYMQHGNTWSVYEDFTDRHSALLHNLKEWQAKAIVAILNAA